MSNKKKGQDKIVCAMCTLEIKPINEMIPRKCPNCDADLSLVNLRCMGNKCKGNTLIVEPSGYGIYTTSCPECSSRELFETIKPMPFAVTPA